MNYHHPIQADNQPFQTVLDVVESIEFACNYCNPFWTKVYVSECNVMYVEFVFHNVWTCLDFVTSKPSSTRHCPLAHTV